MPMLIDLDNIDVFNTADGDYGKVVSFIEQPNGRLLVRSDEPAKEYRATLDVTVLPPVTC